MEIKNITPADSHPIKLEKLEINGLTQNKRTPLLLRLNRVNKKVFLGAAIILFFVFLFFFGLLPAFSAYASLKKASQIGQQTYAALQEKDLERLKTGLADIKKELSLLKGSVEKLGWLRVIPFLGNYWQDANAATKASLAGVEAGEIVVRVIEPYADILGFGKGVNAAGGPETAENRMDFIVKTIDGVLLHLDEIGAKIKIAKDESAKIDPNRYPEHFRGIELKSKIKQGIRLTEEFSDFVINGKPLLLQLPYLLGIQEERTYLLLFQNDKELRPTGGFITAYSIIKVKDGKVTPVSSNDIYNLDRQLNSRIPAPEIIKNYLPLVQYWHLRDMNLSPDFKISMDTFAENYAKIRSIDYIDGIIAVDTFLAVELLKVTGPIGVPGFGNFSADITPRCNCPLVIYELESIADLPGPVARTDASGKTVYKMPDQDNRKAVLGPLASSLLANAMGQPKEKVPDLFDAFWRAITEKHVLFWMKEQKVQEAIELAGLGGRIKDFPGDYLHINDSNFAGAKANLYVQQEVNLTIEPDKDGSVNTLTIKYKNPQKYDGWLNGPYRDLVRIYVPSGSILLESSGSDDEVKTYEELGKTVFQAFFILRPEGVRQLTFKYKTPIKKNGEYRLLIQKQPGTEGHPYVVQLGRNKEEFYLTADRELRLQ